MTDQTTTTTKRDFRPSTPDGKNFERSSRERQERYEQRQRERQERESQSCPCGCES